MSDDELLHGFVSTALPADQFHHEQHVRVAWLFVRQHGMPTALSEFATAIKRFADAKGVHGLYHETITWAFVLIIAERLARKPADAWDTFAADNADLLCWKPSILDRYYSKDLLASALARTTFVMPDLLNVEAGLTASATATASLAEARFAREGGSPASTSRTSRSRRRRRRR